MYPTLRLLGSLIKPRIVALLCLTGASALFAAGGLSPLGIAAFVAAGGLIAAGSAVANCYYDRDIDRLMDRTADRPLPSGELDPRAALGFSALLITAGTAIGLLVLPTISVAYMLFGALAYLGLYTILLKRRHPIGVVLGGSAGSFPVLAGWTAVRPLDVSALIMATFVFVWTPAHAWTLAYVYRDDFAAAGIPTLPVVADGEQVRRSVWLSAVAATGTAVLVVPFATTVYTLALALAAPLYLVAFWTYYRAATEPTAVRAFFTSNLFVAVLFSAWAANGLLATVPAAVLLAEAVTVAGLYGWLWRSRPRLRGVPAAAVEGWERPIERILTIGTRTR